MTLVMIGIAMTLYFAPTLIAGVRGNPNTLAIGLINLFLGWTFIGWVVALVMAAWAKKTQLPAPGDGRVSVQERENAPAQLEG